MQTRLTDSIKNTPQGQEADGILRACVHCGFCTATCPTYQLLGDELDGPRGRIYLIKGMLEGEAVSRKTQLHLDRCLTCRSCETTCPSGVQYGRLVDIGRMVADERVERPWRERVARRLLRAVIPHPSRFALLLRLGQAVRPLLPSGLRKSVPPHQSATRWPEPRHARRMVVLDGCAQPSIAPNINAATARVLDSLGISLIKAQGAGCCGAVSYHLNTHGEGLDFMRRNIDAWWPHIESGVEAIVITASGCGALVKEYGHILRHDPRYAEKAARVSALSRDIGEIIAAEDIAKLPPSSAPRKIAVHSPCTLQHGQKLPGVVEKILQARGFELTPVPDAHLCCGSAGTYSILQKDLSRHLLKNKLIALQSAAPAIIVTANIGCLTHLQSGTEVPVRHWIEVLDMK
ncbi:MAG: glycolate oxidase subunit GlcF [Pseudomonadota bacterium]